MVATLSLVAPFPLAYGSSGSMQVDLVLSARYDAMQFDTAGVGFGIGAIVVGIVLLCV
jgi:hypothetical protein